MRRRPPFQQHVRARTVLSDDESGDEATAVSGQKNTEKKASTMQTIVTSDGTEIPERLNNKVFVDGLPFNYEAKDGASLEDLLAQFVLDWKVGKLMHLIKRPGQGFGYLAFRSPNSVPVAVQVLNGRKFLGRALRVELPKPRSQASAGRGEQQEKSYVRQVLVSDLSKITEPEVIREVLRDCAPQLEEKVETIKMAGKGRKAFVTLASVDDVQPFVNFMNGFSLLGRTVTAEVALPPGSLPYSKVKPLHREFTSDPPALVAKEESGATLIPIGLRTTQKVGSKKSIALPQVSRVDLTDQGPKEVFVGNLPEATSNDDLKMHFSAAGRVKQVEIMSNQHTGEPMGIARVEFALPGHAKYAREHLNGSKLNGATLRVDRGEDVSDVPLSGEIFPQPEENEDEDEGEAAYLRLYGVKSKKQLLQMTKDQEASRKKKEAKSTKKVKKQKGSKKIRGDDSDEEGPEAKKNKHEGVVEFD